MCLVPVLQHTTSRVPSDLISVESRCKRTGGQHVGHVTLDTERRRAAARLDEKMVGEKCQTQVVCATTGSGGGVGFIKSSKRQRLNQNQIVKLSLTGGEIICWMMFTPQVRIRLLVGRTRQTVFLIVSCCSARNLPTCHPKFLIQCREWPSLGGLTLACQVLTLANNLGQLRSEGLKFQLSLKSYFRKMQQLLLRLKNAVSCWQTQTQNPCNSNS